MDSTNNLPKISIITPSCNQGKFIRQTIDSVLSQDYPNLEYIVIDGQSNDNTLDILKSYGNRIKWISEKDNGQTEAINKGIKMSSGEIIAYLNSDDYYLPETLFTIGNYFMTHEECMWLTGDYEIVNEKGETIQSYICWYKKLLRNFSSYWIFCVANFIIQPSTFWRRNIVNKIGYFDDNLHYEMDYDYWLKIWKKYQLHILPYRLSAFRIHSASKGFLFYDKQFAEEYKVVARYTKNKFILNLHKLHSYFIVLIYKLIKKHSIIK